ncbi:hypothetical protein GCM10010466_35220 [Planomonospora alba]|uniref:SMI1/KNR4 family protein n=1 Tax=Planomonospora alba TaxID=161354 RepID=A0ABP6NC93_9ACTN
MSDVYSPVPELNLLKELQDRLGGKPYSGEFELIDYGDLRYVSGHEDPEFQERLIPFARACGSGSFYALWRCDDREDLATLPVIFCGDEGEIFIEASDLRDLFRLLALDGAHLDGAELEEEDHSDGHHEYLAWLNEHFGLAPPQDAAPIHEAAFQRYAGPFAEWWLQVDPDYHPTDVILKELSSRWALL